MSIKILLMHCLISAFPLISLEGQIQNPISDFLRSSKEHYDNISVDPQNSDSIHFVMGNESADLDSTISSIAYAYLLSQGSIFNQSELYIPVLNIYREEIALRKDILYLFRLLDISINDILFLDDNIPLNTLFAQKRLRLNLVDHNTLKPKQEHLSDAVERIIDHHIDEKKDYPLIKNQDKLIAVVGSNATLIGELILSNEEIAIFPDLATFLLAPILIDTANLTSVEKTTQKDIYIAKVLEKLAFSRLPLDFYNKLLAAKNDISDLTPAMLLSKDFKEYLDGDILYGISSLPSSVHWNVKDLDLISSIMADYAYKRDLAFLILLMFSDEPQTKRKLLIYSPSTHFLKIFDGYVQTDEKLKDLLIPEFFSEEFQVSYYRTEKTLARKQLQPLFKFSEIFELQPDLHPLTAHEPLNP